MRRRFDDERGAVVAVVALSLVGLLGMVVLTVDVGGIVTKRRAMVTAADAAALAAAQSCALGLGALEAEAQADAIAGQNVAGTSLVDFSIDGDCVGQGEGTVTVEYLAPQPLFFAPVLGFAESTDVHATATAAWEGVGHVKPLPVMLDLGAGLGQCDIPRIDPGDQCAFWYGNGTFTSSRFGLVNLDDWNVPGTATCSNAGASSRLEWIDRDYPDYRDLNWPEPTYVCADSGLSSNWRHGLGAEVGEVHPFPINDPDGRFGPGHGSVDRRGLPCLASAGCVPDKFDIVGFAHLRIDAVFAGNDPLATGPGGSCWPQPPDASGACLVATWMGSTVAGSGGAGPAVDFGVRALRLTE